MHRPYIKTYEEFSNVYDSVRGGNWLTYINPDDLDIHTCRVAGHRMAQCLDDFMHVAFHSDDPHVMLYRYSKTFPSIGTFRYPLIFFGKSTSAIYGALLVKEKESITRTLADYIETDAEIDATVLDTYRYSLRQFIKEINSQFTDMAVSRTLEVTDDFRWLSHENGSLVRAYEGLVECLKMTDKRRINVSQLYSNCRKILQVTNSIIDRGGI